MKQNYEGYTSDRLLNDDYFVEWVLHPTRESNEFWEQMQREKQLNKEIQIARSFIRAVKGLNVPMPDDEKEELLDRIIARNKRLPKIVRMRWAAASAACIVALAALGGYWMSLHKTDNPGIMAATDNIVDFGSLKDITLVLSDDKSYSITDPAAYVCHNPAGDVIVDAKDGFRIPRKENDRFNQLLVPSGKRSKIVFGDGTTAWLNANSRLVYPIRFDKDLREVYAEGEVLFDVASDPSRPFVVKTIQTDVRVLGTLFNVRAYSGDSSMDIILAEGAVEVSDRYGQILRLYPDETMTVADGKIINKEHIDASGYISWTQGFLLLKGDALGGVLKRLGNYYGIGVIPDPAVTDIPIYGKLNLNNTLDYLLELISLSSPVRVTAGDGVYYVHGN